jgi:hypothetical protein
MKLAGHTQLGQHQGYIYAMAHQRLSLCYWFQQHSTAAQHSTAQSTTVP